MDVGIKYAFPRVSTSEAALKYLRLLTSHLLLLYMMEKFPDRVVGQGR